MIQVFELKAYLNATVSTGILLTYSLVRFLARRSCDYLRIF